MARHRQRRFFVDRFIMGSQFKAELGSPPLGAEVYQRLCRAREFIDHCYDHPLDLDQISSQACFSRFHFLRLFRQAFAKTPHQYLIERRIEKAKELLTADNLRVTDVCFEVGFQSLGSFSTLFHKYVGHAPVIYREKSRQRQAARKKVPGCFLFMYKLDSLPNLL